MWGFWRKKCWKRGGSHFSSGAPPYLLCRTTLMDTLSGGIGMGKNLFFKRFLANSTALLIAIALLKLFLHLITNNRLLGYGYFRDELYYLVCAERLDFGYVDHPPLAPLLLSLDRRLLGDSIFALRLLPAVAGAATVFLTGLMARQLGGGRFAQSLAALALTLAPVHLVINGFFSPNAFEVLLWTVSAYILLLLLKQNNPRLWPWVGVVAGIGLQMKHTMALFGLGMLLGLLMTSARRHLRSRWLWLGGVLAFLIFLPNLIWQMRHHWPSLEFYANANLVKNVPTPPGELMLTQMLVMNPLTLPIWLVGLFFFLFAAEGRPYRMLGWVYLAILSVLIVGQSSRPDRLAGAYPMLLAPGARIIERTLGPRRALAAAAMGLLVLGGLLTLPIGLPILPPETTARYAAVLGGSVQIEQGKRGSLPQYFADRLGWEEMVATVAQVHRALPPEERARAIVLAGNYGQAGAVDFLGRELGLPEAISGHNTYFLWGPGDASGEVVIAIGVPEGDLREFFEDVTRAATARCDYCLQRERPVYVARWLKVPLQELWPQVKHYD